VDSCSSSLFKTWSNGIKRDVDTAHVQTATGRATVTAMFHASTSCGLLRTIWGYSLCFTRRRARTGKAVRGFCSKGDFEFSEVPFACVGTESISWTSLWGHERIKLLEELDLEKILPRDRAQQTRALWSMFMEVYNAAHADKILSEEEISQIEVCFYFNKRFYLTNALFEQEKTLSVAALFCQQSKGEERQTRYQPCLYPNASVTPYLHAMVAHLADHLRLCRDIGIPLRNFSTQAVEKKNHMHNEFFFHHTTRNGGKKNVLAIKTIMQKENRFLYSPKNIAKKITKIAVKKSLL
jgi:hypothetical protein